ncbi:unnamed protein product [Peronospora effusa]|nr:unnamed protein product [Peronospora effusa]
MTRQIKRWRRIDEKNVDEVLWLEFVAKDFRKVKKAMYSRLSHARLISHYYNLDYENAKKVAKKAADAAARKTKKAADAAARKAEEAENAVKKAEMAPYEAMLSTLRRHFKNDIALRNSLAKGLEVDDWKMRQTAEKLQKMLDSSRPQEDRSKVSAPGAELDSNFDVHG